MGIFFELGSINVPALAPIPLFYPGFPKGIGHAALGVHALGLQRDAELHKGMKEWIPLSLIPVQDKKTQPPV